MMWKRFREKYIGDRAFYKLVLTIALPVMIQNGITSFVNMLDNLMVGGIGTEHGKYPETAAPCGSPAGRSDTAPDLAAGRAHEPGRLCAAEL